MFSRAQIQPGAVFRVLNDNPDISIAVRIAFGLCTFDTVRWRQARTLYGITLNVQGNMTIGDDSNLIPCHFKASSVSGLLLLPLPLRSS